ncbi:hypothetical protein PZB74_21235 [Porifericola rhodea]|uniref:hypothetical protein n=1 Tax=Porifericola rhodea TaxID=930972 RepID=UPI0026663CBD|nr:hypothetical protein [Porifericola rhodea]WKN31477.1 hypothetical protein PZB74_21235 [Porifericola rhodea]
MGTDQPNPNAVLELVSKEKNQGLLVPRLNSSEIAQLQQKLTENDNGLLVFVENEGKFYYWWINKWYALLPENNESQPQEELITLPGNSNENTALKAGEGIEISNNLINNVGDLDNTNELQDLNSVLSRGANANGLRIKNIGEPVDAQDAATRSFVLSQIAAAETPALTYDSTLRVLSLEGGNSVTLSKDKFYQQDLSLNANQLKVTDNPSATSIDLSPYLDNTDNQTLNLSGSTLSISNGNSINLTSLNTDSQSLALSGNTLSISGSGSSVDLSSLQDGTGTDNQNLIGSRTGNDITIGITNGGGTSFSVEDDDSDATNETVSDFSWKTADRLKIVEAGNTHEVDFSSFQKNDLPEGQVLVGNSAGKASSVNISGDIQLNSDGTMTITLDAITTAKILDQAVTTAKIANQAVTKDKINADVAGEGLAQNADGSLELNIGGGGLQLNADQLQLSNTSNGQILIGDGSQVNARSISGDVSLANNGNTQVTAIQGRNVSTDAPGLDDVLTWNGSSWEPAAVNSSLFGDQQWYSGTITPTSLNPIEADNGDYYYDTNDNRVYRKSGGSWILLGGYNTAAPAPINTGGIADSYRTPILYMGDEKPVEGDNIGNIGDFYYSVDEKKLYYRYLDNGDIKWKGL